MTRKLAFAGALAAALSALSLGGCSTIAFNQGFQQVDVNPADVAVGTDTKSTVTEKLGSPSVTATMDPNTWYYVTQTSSQIAFYRPRITNRTVVAIAFNPADEKVVAVNKYGIEAGKVIAYNGRETPTLGRELSIAEQLLGNLGNAAPFLDDGGGVPGSRPGDR